ncbi:MAG TPA: HAD-IB family phosphatase [Candidatus Limnocylindria bacterium]|nr:HAD-IB family phosphatase [Candidatus Limnocylindria bacterium]
MTTPDEKQAGGPEVVACDLEGTLTGAETWRGLARRLRATGREGRYRRFILRRLPVVAGVRLGVVDRQRFRDRWLADFAVLLRGLRVTDMDDLAERVVEEDLWPARREDVVAELEAHRAAGREVLLCSGTYQPVLEVLARRLGGQALGTVLEQHEGRLTGRLSHPPNTGARKTDSLSRALAGRTLRAAYGDSLADTGMLEASQEAVAVRPEAGLRQLAVARGWRILEGA